MKRPSRPGARAREVLADLLSGRPGRLLRAAEAALGAGQLERAAELAQQATARAPQWAPPFHVLARVAAQRGETDAEEHFEREALLRDPRHAEAAAALLALEAWRRKPIMDAWAHYHADRWNEAAEAFYAALLQRGARVPWSCSTEILAGLGWCRLELGASAAAADAFWDALGAAPADVAARQGLAISWYRLGWYTQAQALLAELVAERPELGGAWAFHGWCAYALGDWSAARERFERARAADPGLADARWGRAWSLYRLGQPDAALPEFLAALESWALHPSCADALDVALWVEGYGELLEPLAAALLRARAPWIVEAAAARAERAPRPAAGAPRLRAVLARGSGDALLDALQALVERRTGELERLPASPRGEDERLRFLWIRARACELQGNLRSVAEILGQLSARHAARREWRELAARLALAKAGDQTT